MSSLSPGWTGVRSSVPAARAGLEDGASPEAAREAPWGHTASHFSDYIPAIEEDEIDGKLHAEGMHCLTRHDPQTFSFSQRLPAEQAACAGRSAIRNFDVSDNALRPPIANLAPQGRICLPRFGTALPARPPQTVRNIHRECREACPRRCYCCAVEAPVEAPWPGV